MAVLFPAAPTFPFTEILTFKTQTPRGGDGSEQRIAIRKVPRQVIEYSCAIEDDAHWAQCEAMLHRCAKRLWYVPLWGEAVHYGGVLASGRRSIAVETDESDWRTEDYGNCALIWESHQRHEVVTVSGASDGILTVSPLALRYEAGVWIMPCRTGYLSGPVRKSRWSSGFGLATLIYEIIDNGCISGYEGEQSYDNIPVLTDPAGMPGDTYDQSADPDAEVIDTPTGRRILAENTDFNIDSCNHLFVNTGRSACWSFRQLIHWSAGPQKTFLVPTFREDLTLCQASLATDETLVIDNAGLADYMDDNMLRDYLAVKHDGELIVRRIEGLVELDSYRERITLDSPIGIALPHKKPLSWVDCCRFGTDAVTIQWVGHFDQRISTALTRVQPARTLYGAGLYGMGVMP